MSKTNYQYLGEGHTLIRTSAESEKQKVSNGEIIAIEDGLYDKSRLLMGGWREVVGKGENAKTIEALNDSVVRENEDKKATEEAAAKELEANSQDQSRTDGGAVEDGLTLDPTILAPITTTVEEDGKTDITVEVENLDPTTEETKEEAVVSTKKGK